MGLGDSVSVNGRRAHVVAKDVVTDGALVELDSPLRSRVAGPGASGPLVGRGPGNGETMSFEGVRSGAKSCTIVACDPLVPNWVPGLQLRVYTDPVTSGGDSGAALITDTDHVVGFAFHVTDADAPASFSSWIWADSVYQTLHL